MRVGILGSGLMGGKLGTLFARAGHEVVFSYSRSEEKLIALAREAGKNARAGTPAEAAQNADAILFAVVVYCMSGPYGDSAKRNVLRHSSRALTLSSAESSICMRSRGVGGRQQDGGIHSAP